MTKDEALDLALEALVETLKTLDDANAIPGGPIADTIWYSPYETLFDYLEGQIAAIKQALAAPYVATPLVQEPVAWKWHQAPVKTSWGHEMVVADLTIDKDNTVSVYCERDQTAKVEAMFTPPAAPVQVSPLEFVTMVMEKEHLVGKPLFWAEWPNKEKNT